jgi:hypothetical protein
MTDRIKRCRRILLPGFWGNTVGANNYSPLPHGFLVIKESALRYYVNI